MLFDENNSEISCFFRKISTIFKVFELFMFFNTLISIHPAQIALFRIFWLQNAQNLFLRQIQMFLIRKWSLKFTLWRQCKNVDRLFRIKEYFVALQQ